MSFEGYYNQLEKEEFDEWKDEKEKKLREQGILPEGFPIGQTLHPLTVKSYAKLGMDTPDNVYYASRRHLERMKQMLTEVKAKKGEKLEIKTTIPQVFRLKNKEDGKEYLAWSEHHEFKDPMDKTQKLDYDRCGSHEEAEGEIYTDAYGRTTRTELTGIKVVFDKEFSKKSFDELMQRQNTNGAQEFIIGFTKNRGKYALCSEEVRSIKCADDFKLGKFEELWELSRRGLSGTTASLSRLKQPISQDGANSLAKQERFYVNPNAISYVQETYQ
jgi:hypothetical protein